MIIEDLPDQAYRELPGHNWSTVKNIVVSELEYRDYVDRGGLGDKALFRIGRAGHCLLLEEEHFATRYTVWSGGLTKDGKPTTSKNSLAYKEFCKEMGDAGIDVVDESEMERAVGMRNAVLARPDIKALFDASVLREVSITWTDHETGLECKARPDMVTDSALVDLKTTHDVSRRVFGPHAGRMMYYAQLAFYLDGLAANSLARPEAKIVAVESKRPFDTALMNITDEWIRIGRRTYRLALNNLAACLESDTWEGKEPVEFDLPIPDYAVETRYTEEEIITVGGVAV